MKRRRKPAIGPRTSFGTPLPPAEKLSAMPGRDPRYTEHTPGLRELPAQFRDPRARLSHQPKYRIMRDTFRKVRGKR